MAEKPDSGVTSALRSVTRGAGAQFIGMGTTRILGFVTTFLLTRTLGTNLYGVYSFGKTLLSVASTITDLGTDTSIVRFIPQYDNRVDQNRVIGLASLTTLIASLVVGIILYVTAPILTRLTLDQPILTDVLRVLAFVLPFQTLNGCVSSVFRGIELPGYQIITSNIGREVFRLITVGIGVVIGASVVGMAAALVAAWVLAFFFGVGLFLSRTDFRPRIRGSKPELREFYNFSLPLTLGDVGSMLQNRVDILMVGLFLSGSAVGIYNLSTVLSQTLRLPLFGFNMMFPPIAARMYGNSEHANLEALFTRVTRWSFTLSLLPSIGLLIYPSEVLLIFGQDFSGGSMVLSLFVIGNLTSSLVGPSGHVITMTNHQYLRMINEWGLGILNAIFNYIFITQFGLIGAALATAGTLAFVNVVRVVEVWYTEQLFPYSVKFLKPVVAGLISGIVMEGWRIISPLSGIPLMIVGAIAGTFSFGLVLFIMGIEERDKEFFRELVS